jgi:hypothetical protein
MPSPQLTAPPAPYGTVVFPERPGEALSIQLQGYPLRLAYLPREGVAELDPAWDVPGIYLLPLGEGRVYVGKAGQSLRRRLYQQLEAIPGWKHALLVAHTAKEQFSSAAAGFLEGALIDELGEQPEIELVNRARTKDLSVSANEAQFLIFLLPAIIAVIRGLGIARLGPAHSEMPVEASAEFVLEL